MNLVIQAKSDLPIYEQLFDQIAAQIVTGELMPHVCLPSIRVVAGELGCSVITIKKAWEQLEAKGFIYTRAGKGCFVAEFPSPAFADRRLSLAAERLKAELPYYVSLGLSHAELIELITRIYPQTAPND